MKPLQKIINLRKLGFYCNTRDDISRIISSIQEDESNRKERLDKFESLFSKDDNDIS